MKSLKLAPLIGACILFFLMYTYFVNPSDKKSESKSEQDGSQRLVQSTDGARQYDVDLSDDIDLGDADSSADTIRRVKEYADQANEKANSVSAEFDALKTSTSKEVRALEKALKDSVTKSNSGVSDMASLQVEFENLKALINGQNQLPIKEPAPVDNSEWVVIEPVSGFGVSEYDVANSPNSLEFVSSDGFLLSSSNPSSGEDEEEVTIFPVATIPANSPLIGSITLSTLIGRVPRGGSVSEPFSFYVKTGSENLTSQGWKIPYLEEAVWRGTATGDKDLHCVRGKLTSVTFVFTDGSVQTIDNGGKSGLAEITTTNGNNCIPGLLVSNTREYLIQLGGAGALEGVGQQIRNNTRFAAIGDSGSLSALVSSDTANSAIGSGLSTAANRASELILREYEDSFASVVIQSGININIMATSQLDIDYNTKARKVRYDN